MKILKKAISLFLALAMSAGLALSVAACSGNDDENKGGGGSGGTSSGGGTPVHTAGEWNKYGDVSVGFASEEDCPGGAINDSKVTKGTNLKVNTTYYMVVDFTIKSEYDNDGTEMLIAQIEVYPSATINATLQEASTGMFTEIDSGGVTIISLQYRIPEKVSSPSKQRVTVQLTPLFGGAPEVDISFRSNGAMQGVVKSEQIKMALDVSYTKGLKYGKYIDEQTGEVWCALEGIGTAGNSSEIVIPYTVDGGIVRSIGANALSGNENLRKVVIPDSVTGIEDEAFANCPNLKDINIPATIDYVRESALENCGDFVCQRENSIVYIGTPEAPHKYLSYVSRVNDNFEIPSDTEMIFPAAFSNEQYLYNIVFNENLKIICNNAFENSGVNNIDLPANITHIGESAFENCKYLKNVKLSENLESIGGGAFSGCDRLESLQISTANTTYKSVDNNILTRDGKTLVSGTKTGIIPEGVKAIGEKAFIHFEELESVTIPQGVKTIGDEAFGYCSNLTNVILPSSLTAVGVDSFAYCKIEQLNFPSSLTYIGSGAFVSNKLTEINLPEGVTHIGAGAFSNGEVTKVTIPQSVIYLGASAFSGCDNLKQINYNSVYCQDLERNDSPFEPSYSRYGDENVITTVNIGANVVHLPAFLFGAVTNYASRLARVRMENLNFLGDKLQSIGEGAFDYAMISKSVTLPSKIRPVVEKAFEKDDIDAPIYEKK